MLDFMLESLQQLVTTSVSTRWSLQEEVLAWCSMTMTVRSELQPLKDLSFSSVLIGEPSLALLRKDRRRDARSVFPPHQVPINHSSSHPAFLWTCFISSFCSEYDEQSWAITYALSVYPRIIVIVFCFNTWLLCESHVRSLNLYLPISSFS